MGATRVACSTQIIGSRPNARAPISRLGRIDIALGVQREIGCMDAIQPDWSPHNQRIAYATVEQRLSRCLDDVDRWQRRVLCFSSDRCGSMNLWCAEIDEKTGRTPGVPEAVTRT